MKRKLTMLLALTGSLTLTPVWADKPAAGNIPDSPDQVEVGDVIAAREALMMAIEDLMKPIDTYTVDDSIDPDVMRENGKTIAAMLQAVPHLFPENSNLYDPDDQYPATLALPAIWENFSGFYSFARAALNAATGLSETGDDPGELRAASLALRGSCDSCHAVNLLPYEEPGVSQEDLDFDFDSVFGDD